ncbi:hypothetical protein AB205_0074530 [Aquarana catesbeiana]|uniref:Uncharacterized protein n=2 Tax=Aquarana catesbeiana TaxID=8400 RepID=A0A2G9RB41_AQUCT|nr:hypothetical protein AB205_0126720 [Aquarana catesbeiana]PIO25054.1 hypothetical protein AB205_0074530 [Aquarana catesbeiana]
MVRPQIEGAGSVQKNQECCKKERKDSGHPRTPGTPNLLKKGKSTHHNLRMWREVHEVVEIVTTTGDVDVVEEETHFTSASALVLIGEIMVCNRDLEKIKENINDVQQKMKNIVDVLGRI